MANGDQSVAELFKHAVLAWSKPAMIRDVPSWNGQPIERALCEALAERIAESECLLFSGLSHESQHVVAYCLLTLDLGSSARLRELPELLVSDKRHITIIRGSFANQFQIGDLARKLRKKSPGR